MIRIAVTLALIAGCRGKTTCEDGDDCATSATTPTTSGTTPSTQVGNDVDLDSFPPVVVRTLPVSGDLAWDPANTRIEVEFNKPMMDQSWAWVQIGGYFPPIGTVSYETAWMNVAEGTTLDPDTAYRVWFNDPYGQFNSFVDQNGIFAIPYPLVFHTGDGQDPSVLNGFEAAVLGSSPAPGEEGVDPNLDRIEVTFSMDMLPDDFGWVRDGPKTELSIVDMGWDDARTAWATVDLDPGTTYAVWINTRDQGEFRDASGWLSAPWLLTFRTADE